MKKYFFYLLISQFCLVGCWQNVQVLKGRGYEISGKVVNCEGCEVVLQLYDYNRYKLVEQTPIQVDTIRDGGFMISGRTNRTGFYEIHIKDAQTKRTASTKIYLPANSIKITADMNGLPPGKLQRFTSMLNAYRRSGSFDQITVNSSSPVQQDITRFFLLQDSLLVEYCKKEKLTSEIFRSTYDSGNRTLMNAWADSVRLVPQKHALYKAYAADLFIRENPESDVVILAMLENMHEKSTNYRFKQYFSRLSQAQQKSFYGQILAQKLNPPVKSKKVRQHWVGSKITYLKGSTPEGKKVDVLEIFKQNKLTLVHFWASWHNFSRSQMPAYQQIYEQNKNQGFDIIAVSFDKSSGPWIKAIAEANLTFRHLSELQGESAEEYLRFRIKELPFNILFDQNGTMVAVDLTPQELAQKLNQVQ